MGCCGNNEGVSNYNTRLRVQQLHVDSHSSHTSKDGLQKIPLLVRLGGGGALYGGVMLPEKSQGKVLQATVVAVGPGSVSQKGNLRLLSVKFGGKVHLPAYGGTKVTLDDKDYFLFCDGDILGKSVN